MTKSDLGSNPSLQLGAIILAAGASTRMHTPKLLLPWGPTTVLGHLIAQWRQLGTAQVGVVFAARDQLLVQELDRLGLPVDDRIPNPYPELGMFSSIQAAARWPRWQRSLTHFAIVLGDQPHLSIRTLGQLLSFAKDNLDRACQPSHRRHARHPVILPRNLFQRLTAADDSDLKQFLKARTDGVAFCDIDDAALDLDLDTPTDYLRALDVFRPGKMAV